MKTLLSYLGTITIISGFVVAFQILPAVVLKEYWIVKYFLAAAVLFTSAGFYLHKKFEKKELDLQRAFVLAALTWLIVPLICALPLMFSVKISFLDAYCEMMSGLTTTGSTVFLKPSELPGTIIFFRSFAQWVGGAGIVLVYLAVLAPTNIASKLYAAEGRTEKIEPSTVKTAHKIIWIYLGFTLIGALAFYLAGFSVFDAVNHVMSALSTGGFSRYDQNFAGMPLLIKIVAMVLMIIGAISFAVHERLISRDFKSFYTNLEVRTLFTLISIFSFLLYFDGVPLVDSAFQVVSALTTTGFSSMNLVSLSEFSKYLLSILMIIGAGYGGTGGGIKLLRFIVIIKSIEWFIRKIILPKGTVIPFKIHGKHFGEEEVFSTLLFALLYVCFLVVGSLIFVKFGHSTMYSVFEMASSQGNVGFADFTRYTHFEKVIATFYMWLGRIEIIPALVLFSRLIRRES